MKTDLVFTHVPITDEKLSNRTVVMIDVLRTSTTICVALKNGAKTVIPVEGVPAAMELLGNLSRDNVLLCGEREGKLIEGFDLGNSPLEYEEKVVKGKSLIICTTDGSVALTKMRSAKSSIVCGLVNITACADFVVEKDDDLLIVCAGHHRQFNLEDAVCGGMLVNILQGKIGREMHMNDGTEAAVIIYQKYRDDYLKLLRHSDHGTYLKSLDLGKDLKVCAEVDSLDIVPEYIEGRVILRKDGLNGISNNAGL